jgi:hypothetical protein
MENKESEMWRMPVARTECANGTSLSIQASMSHHCRPRTNNAVLYSHYEVGFIEDKSGRTITPPESWKQYSDSGDFPSDIYAEVPVETILYFINEICGGRADD